VSSLPNSVDVSAWHAAKLACVCIAGSELRGKRLVKMSIIQEACSWAAENRRNRVPRSLDCLGDGRTSAAEPAVFVVIRERSQRAGFVDIPSRSDIVELT